MRYLQLLLLTITLACFSTIELKAQDKYEFAAISLYRASSYQVIEISSSNGDFEEIKFDKAEFRGSLGNSNITPLLSRVQKMTIDGWEVISIYGNHPLVSYYLKRKLK